MDSFYLIVLAVASLVLIVALAFMGWNMSNAKKGSIYPSITTTCPDNWTPTAKMDLTTKNVVVKCMRPSGYNTGGDDLSTYMTTATSKGYNASDTNVLDFSSASWAKDKDPTCEKREWAKKYKIAWDSVASANYC
jgi:hypothetical protein